MEAVSRSEEACFELGEVVVGVGHSSKVQGSYDLDAVESLCHNHSSQEVAFEGIIDVRRRLILVLEEEEQACCRTVVGESLVAPGYGLELELELELGMHIVSGCYCPLSMLSASAPLNHWRLVGDLPSPVLQICEYSAQLEFWRV